MKPHRPRLASLLVVPTLLASGGTRVAAGPTLHHRFPPHSFTPIVVGLAR